MRRFSTVHALALSFYSRPFYRDVGRNWRGIAFAYLFLLISVCSIPVMFRLREEFSEMLSSEAPKIVRQVPVITISGGEVSIVEQVPYIVKYPGDEKPFLVIDTRSPVGPPEGSEAVIVLTKNSVIFGGRYGRPQAVSLADIKDLVIDQATIYDMIESFLDLFPAVVYPFAVLFSFILHLLQVLLLAFVMKRLLRVPGAALSYRQMVSLAAVSMTPAIIIDSIVGYLAGAFPFWWVMKISISAGYLYFAVLANADNR